MKSKTVKPTFDGLAYMAGDARLKPTPGRKSEFKTGWENSQRNPSDRESYTEETLKKLTWNNLGYRLGRILGPASDEFKERMYDLCASEWEARRAAQAPTKAD